MGPHTFVLMGELVIDYSFIHFLTLPSELAVDRQCSHWTVYTVNCRCNGRGGAEDVPPLSSSSEESDMMYASRASTLVGKAGAGGWGSMGERHEERRCVGGGHEEGLTPIQEGQGLIRTHSTFRIGTYSPWKPGLCQFPVRIHLPTYTCARRQCHGLFRRTSSGMNYGCP